MGQDLILTALIQDKSRKLDWAAGRRTAQRLPLDTIQERLEEVRGEPCETGKEARAEVNSIISTLKSELKNGGRDEVTWEVRGALVHVRGGTSWGDSPSEGFETFDHAWRFPEVLRSIGFEVG